MSTLITQPVAVCVNDIGASFSFGIIRENLFGTLEINDDYDQQILNYYNVLHCTTVPLNQINKSNEFKFSYLLVWIE